MNTSYFCAICDTKPDQISHHKSHLQTQKHKENREEYKKELKYFSIYKLVHPSDWLNHSEIKEIILKEYNKVLTTENRHSILIEKLDVIDKFIKFKPEKVFFHIVDGKRTTSFIEPSYIYKLETGLSHNSDHNAYFEWCIEKILKSKETICKKYNDGSSNMLRRNENIQIKNIASCTCVKYDILNNIRMNKQDINYFTPKGFELDFLDFNDNALKYACILFNAFGVSHLNKKNKYDLDHTNDIYFHKLVSIESTSVIVNVEGYEKKMILPKKVWVKSPILNNNFEKCIYIEDETIKIKFRNYLIDFYSERKENTHKYNHELEKDIEIVSNMLFDSDLFKNIMKLCEFFFEYKKEIIEIHIHL